MDSGGLKTQENTNIHTSIRTFIENRVENNKRGLRGISKRKAIEKFHSLFFLLQHFHYNICSENEKKRDKVFCNHTL